MSNFNDTLKVKLIPEKPTLKKKKQKTRNGKEIDMLRFKKKIADEMANAIASKIEIDPQSQYSSKYREYISEDFTSNCIVFINRLISESNTLSSELKNENNIHKCLLRIVKELMMDEYEITLLSLFLDDYGWNTETISLEDHLLFVSFLVKKSMKNIDLFMNYYEQIDKTLITSFKQWVTLHQEPKMYSNNEIDLRFRKLKKPFNTYCKTNYIDYNSVVDKILRMSLPYNETNKQKEENLDHTIDDSIPNSSHINFTETIQVKQPIPTQNSEYSYKPTDLLLNSIKYNNIDNAYNGNKMQSLNYQQHRVVVPLQRSNPKKFIPTQIIQDQNLRDNLKATATNSNPLLQNLNFYNNSIKFDESNDNNCYWNQHTSSDNNNPLKQSSNSHLDPINRNENESLQNLLNKSNNNFFRSAFSIQAFFNSELEPFRGSSLMSKNFEQLANERLKGPDARSNTSLGQIRYDDNTPKSLPMNYIQGNNLYIDSCSNKKDNNFHQPNLEKTMFINSLLNNQIKSQYNDPSVSSNENNTNISDKKNLLDMFDNLKEQQTKDK